MLKRLTMVLLLCGAAFRAGATDYTDVWWNTAESGWGVNFVQSDKFIFASFFVYGAANNPTWYTGQLTLGNGGSYTGPLFASTGGYFGTASFDPAQTTRTEVGSVTFTPTAADAGLLTYNVADVSVTKSIQRMPLTPPALSGSYTGAVALATSGCRNPANNDVASVPTDVIVTQSAPGQITVTLDLLFGLVSVLVREHRRRNAASARSSPIRRVMPAMPTSRLRRRCMNSRRLRSASKGAGPRCRRRVVARTDASAP